MATDIQDVIRRIRRTLGDQDAAFFSDDDIVLAASDYIVDTLNPTALTNYETVLVSSVVTGIIPSVIGTSLRLLTLGAALSILDGEVVELNRTSISMDSPGGRVNTTVAAQFAPAAVRAIREEYEAIFGSIANTFPLPRYVDTTLIEKARTTGGDFTAGSAGGAH